jgi:hypothetical protein
LPVPTSLPVIEEALEDQSFEQFFPSSHPPGQYRHRQLNFWRGATTLESKYKSVHAAVEEIGE